MLLHASLSPAVSLSLSSSCSTLPIGHFTTRMTTSLLAPRFEVLPLDSYSGSCLPPRQNREEISPSRKLLIPWPLTIR
ncbi:hypothetical protein BDR06DRAFT_453188 [Suillus hirtellus]|nr:hypothetical protein BDR06DRAFT_453188 [Suillus hirtellus]